MWYYWNRVTVCSHLCNTTFYKGWYYRNNVVVAIKVMIIEEVPYGDIIEVAIPLLLLALHFFELLWFCAFCEFWAFMISISITTTKWFEKFIDQKWFLISQQLIYCSQSFWDLQVLLLVNSSIWVANVCNNWVKFMVH